MSEVETSSLGDPRRVDVWKLQKYAALIGGALSAVYAGYAYVTKLNTVHIQSSCLVKRDLRADDVATEKALVEYRYRLADGFKLEQSIGSSDSAPAASGKKPSLQDALTIQRHIASRSVHMLYCELTNVGQKQASDLELQMSDGGLFSASLNETKITRSPDTSEGIKLGTLLPRTPYRLTAYYLSAYTSDIFINPGNRVALTYAGGISHLQFAKPAIGWAATAAPAIEFIEALSPYSLILLALGLLVGILYASVLIAPHLLPPAANAVSAQNRTGSTTPEDKL